MRDSNDVNDATDVIIIGSGPSGAQAAAALVEAGVRVLMLDYGNVDETYAPAIPEKPFSLLRRTDPEQHRYFLGERFEGVPFGRVRVGAQLTPPRLHVSADVERLMPVAAGTFGATESLALGGLGAAWGAGAFPFSDAELAAMPLTRGELQPHYEAVAERIGVSGARDDLRPFYGDLENLQDALPLDTCAERVMEAYARRREDLNRRGFTMGRPWLAACSREHRGRGPHPLHDMDFWTDSRKAVYRPQWTIDELKERDNFTYVPRRFVTRFKETQDGSGSGSNDSSDKNSVNGSVEVHTRHADDQSGEIYRARAVVLAAGTMSTARIALRSLGLYETRRPLVCNTYTYVPMINLGMLGRRCEDARHSLSQLSAILTPEASGVSPAGSSSGSPAGSSSASPAGSPPGVVQGQMYSYRSLLTFKLLKEAPLPVKEAMRVMRVLTPLFAILGIHHEDRPTAGKYLRLVHDDGNAHGDRPGDHPPDGQVDWPSDRLEIHYEIDDAETAVQRRNERRMMSGFRRLGCWPIKAVRPGHGSSIHYGGTFPMDGSGDELTCDADGRLIGTRSVYLADGSVLPFLPAKGLTFTIMALADRLGKRLARKLKAT